MKIWAKIENNEVVYPPRNDKFSGMFNVDKNEEWLKNHGFSLMSTEELAGYQPVPEEERMKYSTLKIIRNLGADWGKYRQKIETAGVLDQFFAANWLAEDDPVFLAFLKTVPENVKAMLSFCEWNP